MGSELHSVVLFWNVWLASFVHLWRHPCAVIASVFAQSSGNFSPSFAASWSPVASGMLWGIAGMLPYISLFFQMIWALKHCSLFLGRAFQCQTVQADSPLKFSRHVRIILRTVDHRGKQTSPLLLRKSHCFSLTKWCMLQQLLQQCWRKNQWMSVAAEKGVIKKCVFSHQILVGWQICFVPAAACDLDWLHGIPLRNIQHPHRMRCWSPNWRGCRGWVKSVLWCNTCAIVLERKSQEIAVWARESSEGRQQSFTRSL